MERSSILREEKILKRECERRKIKKETIFGERKDSF